MLSVCLFLLCTAVIHGIYLMRLGWNAYRQKKSQPKQKKKKPEQKPKPEPEPIYYIVEKKKKRVKTEYSEPKRIDFHPQ